MMFLRHVSRLRLPAEGSDGCLRGHGDQEALLRVGDHLLEDTGHLGPTPVGKGLRASPWEIY